MKPMTEVEMQKYEEETDEQITFSLLPFQS